VFYIFAFLAGYWLSRIVPIGSGRTTTHSLALVGYVLVGFAITLALSCLVLFLRARTTFIPSGRPVKLITTGPYRWTRNPVYLALTAGYLGATAIVGSVWCLLLVLVPLLYVEDRVIPFEEARLREVFGEEYVAYRSRVRRWL
jgi:protein-S-isoprenylcysteine O-methyltransferase Ste14